MLRLISTLAVTLSIAVTAIISLAEPNRAENILRVGMRVDAKPFSYLEGAEYKGFVVEICQYALRSLDYKEGTDFIFVDVQAADRLKGLTAHENKAREIDLLCDPTTVTIERAGKYFFSPIIFISGGSYISSSNASLDFNTRSESKLKERQQQNLPIMGANGDPVDLRTARLPLEAGEADILDCDKVPPDRIIGARISYVEETTGHSLVRTALAASSNPIRVTQYQSVCIKKLPSHQKAVDQLCRGTVSYHFGDRDILSAYLLDKKQVTSESTDDDFCDAVLAENIYSSEPYAIAISPELDPQKILELRRSVLVALGSAVRSKNEDDGSGLLLPLPHHLFAQYFKEQQMSIALQNLYTVSRVPLE